MVTLNNMKITTKINQKSRERERMLLCAASNYLIEFVISSSWQNGNYWIMKSWTALNINEFILFDMFGFPLTVEVLICGELATQVILYTLSLRVPHHFLLLLV